MVSSDLSVRLARVEDAEDLVRLHYDAVHASAKGHYPPDVLASWSPQPNEGRYSWMRAQIESGHNDVLVAVNEGGIVEGFCIFSPSEGFVHAVYVAPNSARTGIGRRLLRCAESSISEQGLSQSRLNASQNSLGFYLSEGYEVVEPTTQDLSDGSRMECCGMRKSLSVDVSS